MKNSKEQTCPFSLCVCDPRAEKPEHELETESKTVPPQFGTDEKRGQMPWTVFKDVYWI
jgi:hypothetical protein